MRHLEETPASSVGLRWALLRRRILATVFDVPLVAGWLLFSTIVGFVMRPLIDTPGGWDAYAFLTVVLPVSVTFALLEASPRHATPGKARLGLVVVDRDGGRLTPLRSLARSAIKFAPWQMAHTAVFHLVAGSDSGALVALSISAQLIVLASVAVMVLDPAHRALHDIVAGTRVTEGRTDQ